MDDELWNQVYRVIRNLSGQWTARRGGRRGHPDDYAAWEIALPWVWTALWDQPLTATLAQWGSPRCRRAFALLGFTLPPRLPHESTLRRRACGGRTTARSLPRSTTRWCGDWTRCGGACSSTPRR